MSQTDDEISGWDYELRPRVSSGPTTIEEYAKMLGTPLYPAQIRIMEALERGEVAKVGRRHGRKFALQMAEAWRKFEAGNKVAS